MLMLDSQSNESIPSQTARTRDQSISRRGAAAVRAEDDPAEASPIDYVHLARYTMGDAELEREILHLFRDQLPDLMNTLAASTNAGEAWRQTAHALKGSALAVGAQRMAREARAAEECTPQSCRTVLTNITAAAEELIAHIDRKWA